MNRRFIRHPTNFPIVYTVDNITAGSKESLKNISQGGLCFDSQVFIEPGSEIHVMIPVCQPRFEVDGLVVWCHENNSRFDVGIVFRDARARFSVRMIEQICQIELYRKGLIEKEGRTLTAEEAAREWVEKFAADFPV